MGHFVLMVGREQELCLLVWFSRYLDVLTFESRARAKGYALLAVLFPHASDYDRMIPWGLRLPSEFRLNSGVCWCWILR
jgi:hypothetical protein